ncbi:unnamed protein product [Ectocarpus sp. 12 AP-2014]
MGFLDDMSEELDSVRRRLKRAGIEWKGGNSAGGGRRGAKGTSSVLASGITQARRLAVGGGGAFVAVLALSQALQGFALRVSCSSPLGLPTALGFATVAAASVASVRVAEGISSGLEAASCKDSQRISDPWRSVLEAAEQPPNSGEIGAGSFGLVLFRALGGKFSSVAPSALHMPGAFSRLSASLPATLEYASDGKRQALAALGKNFGCHTCGTRAPATFIADHMPPLKTVKLANAKLWRRALRQTVSQRFYPQCQACSTLQSAAVRSGQTTLRYHLTLAALRPYHATGGLLVLGSLLLAQQRQRRGGSTSRRSL